MQDDKAVYCIIITVHTYLAQFLTEASLCWSPYTNVVGMVDSLYPNRKYFIDGEIWCLYHKVSNIFVSLWDNDIETDRLYYANVIDISVI